MPDSFEGVPHDNVSVGVDQNYVDSSMDNPVVQTDMLVMSKFWANGADYETDNETHTPDPDLEDSSFTQVISKSKKKKMRRNRNRNHNPNNIVHNTRSRAANSNLAQ